MFPGKFTSVQITCIEIFHQCLVSALHINKIPAEIYLTARKSINQLLNIFFTNYGCSLFQ